MREYRKATKDFLRTIIVGNFYVFRLFKVTDAAKQVYYIGERTNRGGTVIGDTEEDVVKQLEAQVPILNLYTEKTK
jgi:hypothetical protein